MARRTLRSIEECDLVDAAPGRTRCRKGVAATQPLRAKQATAEQPEARNGFGRVVGAVGRKRQPPVRGGNKTYRRGSCGARAAGRAARPRARTRSRRRRNPLRDCGRGHRGIRGAERRRHPNFRLVYGAERAREPVVLRDSAQRRRRSSAWRQSRAARRSCVSPREYRHEPPATRAPDS